MGAKRIKTCEVCNANMPKKKGTNKRCAECEKQLTRGGFVRKPAIKS